MTFGVLEVFVLGMCFAVACRCVEHLYKRFNYWRIDRQAQYEYSMRKTWAQRAKDRA